MNPGVTASGVCVDLGLSARIFQIPDGDDQLAVDPNVPYCGRIAAAIVDSALANHHVVGWVLSAAR